MVTVTGRVINKFTGQPIPNATVFIAGKVVNTDSNGKFIAQIEPMATTVMATAMGFIDAEITGSFFSEGSNINITMQPQVNFLT